MDLRAHALVATSTHRGNARSARLRRVAFGPWREERGGSWVASATTPSGVATLRATLAGPPSHLLLEAALQLREGAWIGAVGFEVHMPGGDGSRLEVMDRAYRLVELRARHVLDAWTPLFVRAGERTVRGRGPRFEVRPGEGGGVWVAALADHHEAHPWRPWRACARRYDPSQEGDRVRRSATEGAAGSVWRASLEVWLDSIPAVVPLRFPRGARAAIAFADHADQSSTRTLAPLAEAFMSRGLGWSKSVFADLIGADPAYAALVDQLRVAPDTDVGLHTPTKGRDEPAAVRKALLAVPGSVWIDHQPSTNCEALLNQGALEGSDWHIAPLLSAAGVRYAWAGDVRGGGLNLFDPHKPSRHPAALFTHPQVSGDLHLFTSRWQARGRKALLKRFDTKAIDALERERGLHIAHTYLDTYGGTHGGWSLLRRVPGGSKKDLELRPAAKRLFDELERREAAGTLWVAGIAAIGDHLRAMQQVEVVPLAGGGVRYENRGPSPVSGGSFLDLETGRTTMVDLPGGS